MDISILIERLEKLTDKTVVLVEKQSKWDEVKQSIKHSHVPSDIKELMYQYMTSGSNMKKGSLYGIKKPTEFNKKVQEKDLPTGYSMGIDKDGFFIYTHRARSKSYKNPASISIRSIKFIDSTG